MTRRDRAWMAALTLLALAARLMYAQAVVFPPLDDPAFYVQTARNLVAGRGLVVDAVWSYLVPFSGVTHPSHEYWMPLPTFLMAASIFLFGDSLWAAQLPGLLCGALLPALTYALGRRVWPERRDEPLALCAAACVALGSALLYQSASADSAAPFALLGALTLWLAGGEAGRWRWPLAGALAGLAYLTRADGLLLLLVVLAASLARRAGWKAIGGATVGFLVVALPWWARNAAIFGRPTPVSFLTAFALQEYEQLFNFGAPPTLAGLLERGAGFILGLRWRALEHNCGVLAYVLFPYGLLGLPGLWLLRRRLAVWTIYGWLLFLATGLIFSTPTMAGTFYHSVGALAPCLAVGAVESLRWALGGLARAMRRRLPFGPLALGMLVLAAAQATLAWPVVAARSREEQAQFARLSRWMQEHAAPGTVVMTTQPYTLNYASGYPAVMLPVGQPPDIARAAAQQFSAELLIITQSFGRYPAALEGASGFTAIESLEGALIYRIEIREW